MSFPMAIAKFPGMHHGVVVQTKNLSDFCILLKSPRAVSVKNIEGSSTSL